VCVCVCVCTKSEVLMQKLLEEVEVEKFSEQFILL